MLLRSNNREVGDVCEFKTLHFIENFIPKTLHLNFSQYLSTLCMSMIINFLPYPYFLVCVNIYTGTRTYLALEDTLT